MIHRVAAEVKKAGPARRVGADFGATVEPTRGAPVDVSSLGGPLP